MYVSVSCIRKGRVEQLFLANVITGEDKETLCIGFYSASLSYFIWNNDLCFGAQ